MSEAPCPENVDIDSNVITTPVNGLEVMAAMTATVAPAPKRTKRRRSRMCRDPERVITMAEREQYAEEVGHSHKRARAM